jgi:hypothetical protein
MHDPFKLERRRENAGACNAILTSHVSSQSDSNAGSQLHFSTATLNLKPGHCMTRHSTNTNAAAAGSALVLLTLLVRAAMAVDAILMQRAFADFAFCCFAGGIGRILLGLSYGLVFIDLQHKSIVCMLLSLVEHSTSMAY